jgi:uroporphyrinogen-III synthase
MAADPPAAPSPTLWLRDRHSSRPLRVLITRPADAALETADLVETAGGEPLVCPCLWPEPPADEGALVDALREAPRPLVVAFTSRYAVRALAAALHQHAPALSPSEALAGCYVAAVGPRTAEALADLLRPADLISAGEGADAPASSAAGLAQQLVARFAKTAPAPVLFLRAAEARPTLPAALRGAGFHVTEVQAYRMRAATPAELEPLAAALREGRIDLAPFGSPRSVTTALSVLGSDAPTYFAAVRVGAIGETTASALRQAGLRIDVIASTASFAQLLSDLAAPPR